MTKINYPIFSPSKPTGEDKFEGNSQKRLAKVISDTIKDNSLEKKVIGLEGEWGSGKSNVIKIIEKGLGSENYTFVFDSWGNQEDLTRRSFLEQLIHQLFSNKFIIDKDKWKKLESELLSKTSTVNKRKFPKTKSYWILFSAAVLSFAVLSSFYNDVLSSLNKDILSSIDFGPFWKPFIAVYLIPLFFFSYATVLALKDYLKKRKINSGKNPLKRESGWEILGKIFYWFSGQEVDTTEVENVLEDEPSVKRFREYFSQIEADLKSNNKKMVIVFDNIDRLEEDKVKSLWSSIHTFFAEDTESVESWIIVPYDKVRLNKHFGGNGFIEKTFAINFRVTPPVVTQWEKFLKGKFEDSFGSELVDKVEEEYVIQLFDILSLDDTIKPRRIINYVNDLVALYMHWNEEIESGDIKFRYISLFILTKDLILKAPNQTIVTRTYLEGVETLFEDKEELDATISMLTFGVKKELADEVLLDRQLKLGLRTGDKDLIKSLSNHAAFENYFRRAHESIPLGQKVKGITEIYETINNTFSANSMTIFWNNFATDIILLDNQFKHFNEDHKAILNNTSSSFGEKILDKLFSSLSEDFSKEENQNKYYLQLKEAEEFIEQNKIEIVLFEIIHKTTFSPKTYLSFINNAKQNFDKYRINCIQKKLIDFFYEEEVLKLDIVIEHLNELKIVKNEFDFSRLIITVEENLKLITHAEKDKLTQYLKILKTLSEVPLKISLSNAFYTQLSSAKFNEHPSYEDAFCIAIANFDIAYRQSSHFQTAMTSLTDQQLKKVSSKIEWYFDFDDLLKLITTNVNVIKYPKLKEICYIITNEKPNESRLNLAWALKSFDKIGDKVFDNDTEKITLFVKRLNGWNEDYKSKVESISQGFFKYLELQDLDLIKRISQDSLLYFNALTKDLVLKLFKNENKDFRIFESILNNKLEQKFSDEFYSAYDDYLKQIASEEEGIPDLSFWNKLIDKLDGRKLISTYTSVRDIIINGGEVNEEILHFFEKGLVSYGSLAKKPESSTLKIIIPLIESDKNFPFFLENSTTLVKIIQASNEHKETAKIELQLRYNSDKYRVNEKLITVAKTLDLKHVEESDNSE